MNYSECLNKEIQIGCKLAVNALLRLIDDEPIESQMIILGGLGENKVYVTCKREVIFYTLKSHNWCGLNLAEKHTIMKVLPEGDEDIPVVLRKIFDLNQSLRRRVLRDSLDIIKSLLSNDSRRAIMARVEYFPLKVLLEPWGISIVTSKIGNSKQVLLEFYSKTCFGRSKLAVFYLDEFLNIHPKT